MDLRRLTVVAVCAWSLGSVIGAQAQPLIAENDDFEDATVVATLPYEARQMAPLATTQSGEPACGPVGVFRNGGEFSTWYRYTAGGHVTAVRVRPHEGVVANVYTGGDLESLTRIAGTNHRWAQSFDFATEPGDTYTIQLCGYAEDGLLWDDPLHADLEVLGS